MRGSSPPPRYSRCCVCLVNVFTRRSFHRPLGGRNSKLRGSLLGSACALASMDSHFYCRTTAVAWAPTPTMSSSPSVGPRIAWTRCAAIAAQLYAAEPTSALRRHQTAAPRPCDDQVRRFAANRRRLRVRVPRHCYDKVAHGGARRAEVLRL